MTHISPTPVVLSGFLGFLAVGCASTRGPELVANSHIPYNKAVSQVLKQELLLNIVRRRYGEAPQFLNVSSITSNFTTSVQVSAGASVLNVGEGNTVNTTADAGVSFSDSPTITIVPRQGEDIATQLHSPLSTSTVADLVTAGYGVEHVLNILVESVNNLRGAELRIDRFQAGAPEWREMIQLVAKFARDGHLIVSRFRWNDPYNQYAYPAESITPEMWITTLSTGARRWRSDDGGKTFYFTSHEMAPAMWLDPEARQSKEGQRLMQLLNLQADVRKKVWQMEPARVVVGADSEGQPDRPRPTLKLRMRSLYNVLNLYSYGVHVPLEHEQERRATDLTTFRQAVERGQIQDLAKLFAIRYSESAPESAFQVVRYRGLWFYIDDRDFEAKTAFNALYDLWQLSIKTPAGQTQPTTVIQVN